MMATMTIPSGRRRQTSPPSAPATTALRRLVDRSREIIDRSRATSAGRYRFEGLTWLVMYASGGYSAAPRATSAPAWAPSSAVPNWNNSRARATNSTRLSTCKARTSSAPPPVA